MQNLAGIDAVFLLKFEQGHQMQVGYVKVDVLPQIIRYNSKTVQGRD